jgi:hypothetical protein
MVKVYTGSVMGVRPMTESQREETRRELEWLEQDLVRRRKRLAFWAKCKARAESEPDLPQDMREDAFYFYEQSLKLVASGEKLRAYLVCDLQEQPEHVQPYFYAH